MTNTVATDAVAVLGDPSERTNPRVWEWVKESKIMAVGWLAMRVWLGVMWIQAGWAKLWGAENAAFLHHNGAGVAGFATHAKPAYTWWGAKSKSGYNLRNASKSISMQCTQIDAIHQAYVLTSP